EQLGREGVVLREAHAPCPAVDEDIDGGIRPFGCVDVERFNGSRAIGKPAWCAESRTNGLAVRGIAPGHLWKVRGVFDLVVCGIGFGWIHADPNHRPFHAWRHSRRGRFLGAQPSRRHDCSDSGSRTKKSASTELSPNSQLLLHDPSVRQWPRKCRDAQLEIAVLSVTENKPSVTASWRIRSQEIR